ncbi:hypothetical protein OG339_47295 (plasmid) [Streptosporangium sp. NBC_01495]|uniref:hypothetical protein n=1 Tax=Streptosporangium sp. NBC_01495 TaxID=2903899 RepID=UPI002E2FECBF|nr:hypothetical protein [Streptosporangium sp. NBC_01495]
MNEPLANSAPPPFKPEVRVDQWFDDQFKKSLALRKWWESQLKIVDVIKALGELAAEVEEIASNAPKDILIERVRGFGIAYGLKMLGAVSSQVNFDPHLHEPIAEYPEPGAAVTVIRPGYYWGNPKSPDEEIVLCKALIHIPPETKPINERISCTQQSRR